MIHTMYESKGIGLAATQVDFHERILVIDISEERDDPQVFINPEVEILNKDEKSGYEEGCLSLPGHFAEVERPEECHLNFSRFYWINLIIIINPNQLLLTSNVNYSFLLY